MHDRGYWSFRLELLNYRAKWGYLRQLSGDVFFWTFNLTETNVLFIRKRRNGNGTQPFASAETRESLLQFMSFRMVIIWKRMFNSVI
jgi:hypothetical protein